VAGKKLVFKPSLARVVIVVCCSGLALMAAWQFIASALVAQDAIPTELTVISAVVGVVFALATLWFAPKALRPITVGNGRARIPGPFVFTRVVTSEQAKFVWVKIPKAGAGEDFTPFLRTTDGDDLRLSLLSSATEDNVLRNTAQFARALGTDRLSASVLSRP
jgi:hypothetical protein